MFEQEVGEEETTNKSQGLRENNFRSEWDRTGSQDRRTFPFVSLLLH